MADVEAQPGYLLRRAQQVAVAIFSEECAAFDVTPVQYAALVAVREHPGIDATRLSGLVALDRSTLGAVLERLDAKGLVARRASPADRRVKVLSLNRAGRDLLAAVQPAVEASQARMLAPLRPSERAAMMSLLAAFVAGSDKASSKLAGTPLTKQRLMRATG